MKDHINNFVVEAVVTGDKKVLVDLNNVVYKLLKLK